jgi:hypothetical protein
MRNYIVLSSAPVDEDCVQVSSRVDYVEPMKKECRRFKEMLEKMYKDKIPQNCYFGIKGFPHDFGSYYEVIVYYDDTDEESENFAFKLESNLPLKWDEVDTKVKEEDTKKMKYSDIILMEGSEAQGVLKLLEEEGEESALEFLKQWNYGESTIQEMEEGQTPWGRSDDIYRKDDYVMSYNKGLGYIGLTQIIK